MTEQPTYGCTINGQPAMPILVAEYNQLVARAHSAEAVIARVQALAEEYPAGIDTALIEGALDRSCPDPARTTPDNWTPPPPGDTREQLPDHLLNLIRGSIPDYTSTACVTADTLAVAVHWSHPQRAELGQWAERLHQRCRINQKFTGQLCVCRCHTTTKEN